MVGNKNPLPTLQERLFVAPVFARKNGISQVARNFSMRSFAKLLSLQASLASLAPLASLALKKMALKPA